MELSLIEKNKSKFERYSNEVKYDQKINRLEGHYGTGDFIIIRKPWDLQELGKKYHNCVASYMDAVKDKRSIIVSMQIDGKPSACIELDGTGKYCYQAYAACNRPMSESAARNFQEWTDKYNIEYDVILPDNGHRPIYDLDDFYDYDDDFIPF
jgi:hypothetical protein